MDADIIGPIVWLLTTGLGWLAYQRSVRLDRLAVQTAAIAASGVTTQTIIDGLDRMNENYREENKVLRERLEACLEEST